MIQSARSAYNNDFSEGKYEAFLADLDGLYDHKITFRVAETPVFIDRLFKDKLVDASNDIVNFLTGADVKKLTAAAIPPNLNVPNETDHTLFLALDFAVVREGNQLEPRGYPYWRRII